MLTLRQIEYILKVAARGSISAACKELSVAQSSVIAAIKLAEKLNSIQIFIRQQGRGVTVTPAGQKFLILARRLLSAQSDFNNSLNKSISAKNSTIRVGCYSALSPLVIPPIMKRMRKEYGDIEFIVYEGDPEELKHWLNLGVLDVVVTYGVNDQYADVATPICICPAHAVVRYDNRLAKRQSVSIEELSDQPMILLDLPETRTYTMSLFNISSKRPKLTLRTRSYETVLSAIENGIGFSIMNFKPSIESSQDKSILRRIPISDDISKEKMIVIDPYENNKPTYVKEFIKVLYNYITELGPDNFAVSDQKSNMDLIFPTPKL